MYIARPIQIVAAVLTALAVTGTAGAILWQNSQKDGQGRATTASKTSGLTVAGSVLVTAGFRPSQLSFAPKNCTELAAAFQVTVADGSGNKLSLLPLMIGSVDEPAAANGTLVCALRYAGEIKSEASVFEVSVAKNGTDDSVEAVSDTVTVSAVQLAEVPIMSVRFGVGF
jgi:hypothetical protein